MEEAVCWVALDRRAWGKQRISNEFRAQGIFSARDGSDSVGRF